MLPRKALDEFRDICKKDYGIEFLDEELEKKALEFLKFFAQIYKEPKENFELVEKKYQVCDNKEASNLVKNSSAK